MNHVKKDGFTLIELMLAMSFISLLLLAIAMTTIQVSHIYTKGITLREVNQAGRAVSEELQRSISASSPFEVNSAAPATKYIVRLGGGRLCLGRYTYAWNFGSALKGDPGAPAPFSKYEDGTPVRFAKISDPNASLCTAPISDTVIRANSTDMLVSGDRDLAMHKFTITKGAEDLTIGQTLYAISMVIGTNDRAELVTGDTSCKPPADGQGNENYCSVNQFDIIARAGNKAGGN
ncbi:MAG TPA: prepilin-type N-terminal cleavage/methylation domain-containing protein [Candidatus Saccharimonadales bacterium]|nr:prepilin-type N-terminal cleavage/methylation domain-containing protein [Candidatus Saccharimonadales bacterium]